MRLFPIPALILLAYTIYPVNGFLCRKRKTRWFGGACCGGASRCGCRCCAGFQVWYQQTVLTSWILPLLSSSSLSLS